MVVKILHSVLKKIGFLQNIKDDVKSTKNVSLNLEPN